jgi:hypothetical protein
LVRKLYAVFLLSHGVQEQWFLLLGHGGMQGMTYSGAGLWRVILTWGGLHPLLGNFSVHRSVVESLYSHKIMLPPYTTSHFSLSNLTLQPTLHSGQMPMSDAIFKSSMMWPVKIMGNPGIFCRLEFPTIWEVDGEWFCWQSFIFHIYSIHNKNGHCSRICHCWVCCNCNCIKALRLWFAV